jgi:solute carrier family 39 (zinc transporter), member 1/2/3
MFPLVSKRFSRLHIPSIAFTFAKFFGSGVIIATAFIHLLAASFSELGDACLSTLWDVEYPLSAGFSMIAVFSVFLVELFAMRFARVAFATTAPLGTDETPVALPMSVDPIQRGADFESHHHARQAEPESSNFKTGESDIETAQPATSGGKQKNWTLVSSDFSSSNSIFHSVIIGLPLSTTGSDFNTLFVVVIFHQMFEGLALGSRLAILPFAKGSRLPWFLALAYAAVTPLGMAIGLGVRTTYDSASQTALLVSGILDAISSGILLYTGLVELLAHEFLFSKSTDLDLYADCSHPRRANVGFDLRGLQSALRHGNHGIARKVGLTCLSLNSSVAGNIFRIYDLTGMNDSISSIGAIARYLSMTTEHRTIASCYLYKCH